MKDIYMNTMRTLRPLLQGAGGLRPVLGRDVTLQRTVFPAYQSSTNSYDWRGRILQPKSTPKDWQAMLDSIKQRQANNPLKRLIHTSSLSRARALPSSPRMTGQIVIRITSRPTNHI